MTATLTACLVSCAVLLVFPDRGRLGRASSSVRHLGTLFQPLAAAIVALALVELQISILLVVLIVGFGLATSRELRRRRARAAADHRRAKVLATCDGLAADLAAGLAPVAALAAMVEEWPELRPVAEAAVLGADVPAAFRGVAALPGAGMLRVVAAAWGVAHRSGAGLAEAMGLASRTVRSERETARLVAGEMAAAMATARLLTLLPWGILVLGRGMGGDPLGFLFATTVGQSLLAGGCTLAWLGTLWLQRIADQVEQP